MTKGSSDKGMPVSVGYHNFRLVPGQSIRIEKTGEILIVGIRGKLTKTGKNINSKPVEFKGPPLQGDVQLIKLITPFYAEHKEYQHYIFSVWKGIQALTGKKLKFKPDKKGIKDMYRARLGKFKLFATSATPDILHHVEDQQGNKFYSHPGHRQNIPNTIEYISSCEQEARRQRKAAMDAALEEIRKEEDAKFKRGHRRKIKPEDKVIISKEKSLRAAGLLPPEEIALRKKEDELDAELNARKLSKEQLAQLAKSHYLRLRKAREAT